MNCIKAYTLKEIYSLNAYIFNRIKMYINLYKTLFHSILYSQNLKHCLAHGLLINTKR